jgi:DNA replication initiation complex subunit (GINS family)
MEDDEINYRTLRKIQQTEKNSPILVELKPNFYNDLLQYFENLNNRFEKETSSQKKLLLKDEIENTKKISINIYEQREKKILLATISKVRGGNPDLKNMTEMEKNLFEPVLELILKSRNNFLKIKKEEKNSEDVKPKEEEFNIEHNDNPNQIVRVTDNIPEFIGTDEKKYNLRKNDVLSLPKEMSKMLSKRGVIESLKQ